MTRVVVLGWDGLDIELMERFGITEQFGAHRARIETEDNPVCGQPHTRELWPSMITGVAPDVHGVHAMTEGDGVNWDSAVLNTASSLAQGIVPDTVLTFIGDRLRDRGIGMETKGPDYYETAGVPTVFDDVGGRAISIPNYETEFDRQHGLNGHRDDLWAALAPERVNGGKRPQVDRATVDRLLGEEVGKRVGLTQQAIRAGEPLVWTWFGLLDSIGHMQPALGDEFVRAWYETAAETTRQIREAVDDDTTVIAISDHGIQDGEHTHYATISSDDPAPVSDIDHVFEVADYLRENDYANRTRNETVTQDDQRKVRKDLEALGYV